MPSLRHAAWLTGLVLAFTALPMRADSPGALAPGSPRSAARADAPPDPLRLVPAKADILLKIERPRNLIETVLSLDAFQQLQRVALVREYYDSTNARRLFQLLGYLEKRLGADRLELLDRLAGGGAVLAVQVGADPPPVLLVIQGRDAKLLAQFLKVAEEVLNQELARQESKVRLEHFSYRGAEVLHLADQLYAAQAGSALLLANKEQTLKAALDLSAGMGKSITTNPGIAAAHKLLPPRPMIWAWLNLETIREQEKVKEVVPQIELNPVLGPFVAAWIDTARRSPFLCASLSRQERGFLATVRLPRGLDGMKEAAAVYLPRGPEAAPPLLTPKDVQFTAAYYLDLGRFWKEREKLLSPEALKQLNKFEKNSGRFLGGVKLGTLLSQTGTHQRFVQVVQKPSTVYKRKPKQPVGTFALVQEMRDPAFAKSMDTVLRSAALFASFATPYSVKMVEEKYQGCKIVSYRFPEDRKVPADVNDIRFNFTPSFVKVGNQFVLSSTVELARELVDVLQKEAGQKRDSAAAVRMRAYAPGIAAGVRAGADALVTQLVLGQALSPAEARQQVDSLVHIVEGLGSQELNSTYSRNEHRLDLRFDLGQ
jgi:hypothetical protein